MTSILDLPIEVFDIIFDYLKPGDRKRARLVCHQWNEQLSSMRYRKKMKLRLRPYILRDYAGTLQAIGEHRCIQVTWSYVPMPTFNRCIAHLLDVLRANRFSLEELYLEFCPGKVLRAIFGTLPKMLRLRMLRLDPYGERFTVPKIRTALGSTGFALVTNLELANANDSCLDLVSSLATQLTHLTLTQGNKCLLLRCLNEIDLQVLYSLSLERNNFVAIQPEEFGDGCRRLLSKLETFRYKGYTKSYELEQMLPHCRNLKSLAIEVSTISARCGELIGSLEGLKELDLRVNRYATAPVTLNLPNLEHLFLYSRTFRLGTHLPRLTSVEIYSRLIPIEETVLDLTSIAGIRDRRFRKVVIEATMVREEAFTLLCSLRVDELCLIRCLIMDSVFDIFAEPRNPPRICKIVLHDCSFYFDSEWEPCTSKISKLCAKCPFLQRSVDNGTLVVLKD